MAQGLVLFYRKLLNKMHRRSFQIWGICLHCATTVDFTICFCLMSHVVAFYCSTPLSLITAYMYLHHDGGPQLDQTYILSFRQSHTTLEFKTMYSIMTIGYQLLMTLWSAYQPYGFVDKTQAIYKKCSAVVDSCNHLVLFRIRQPRLMTVF